MCGKPGGIYAKLILLTLDDVADNDEQVPPFLQGCRVQSAVALLDEVVGDVDVGWTGLVGVANVVMKPPSDEGVVDGNGRGGVVVVSASVVVVAVVCSSAGVVGVEGAWSVVCTSVVCCCTCCVVSPAGRVVVN